MTNVTERKIAGFKELDTGWHYGEGVGAEQVAVDHATSLNHEAVRNRLIETDAFPGINGAVMLTIYLSDDDLEFTVEPDGTITFYRERAGEEICYQEGLTVQEARFILEAENT